ncbi:hypothetical protein [Sphingomonas sp.]|jgi:hypothetical protein|uniref:hypothetical protein n=1 Tax=Sphingomonas sp. TaxID=28214 RepID=UPI002E35C1D3|nr:hypothetical protein [Sphingomonas sp.]HEX4695700.1 hypothetical protein [Sphingomonas sp.]
MKTIALTGAAALAVLLAGCNQTGTAGSEVANASYGDNAASTANMTDGNEAAATEAVDVADVPAPVAGTPRAAAAPLVEAASVARRITEGNDIERVPYDGGWAWRENGKTIRTSSSDGRRVSYFHPGDTQPYLVQDQNRAFAYSGGRVQRGYTNGRDVQVDKATRDEADRLARRSEQERTQAERVVATQPDRVQRVRPSGGRDARGSQPRANDGNNPNRGPQDSPRDNGRGPTTQPSPTPTPTTTPTPSRDRWGNRNPRATPTPQPTRDQRGGRDRGDTANDRTR